MEIEDIKNSYTFPQLLLLLYLAKNVKVIPVCFWNITKEKNIQKTDGW